MADNLTPKQRKLCMSRIKGKNTKPELKLRKALWKKGLRYRLNYNLPGKPDLVFVKAKIAIFVDGCFWHGCPLHGSIPKSNHEFWTKKIKKNIERDKEVTKTLQQSGWTVLRFWTHDLKENFDSVITKVKDTIQLSNQKRT